MTQLRRSLLALTAGVALVVSCSESPTQPRIDTVVVVPPPPPVVAAIALTGPTGITVGRTATFTGTPQTSLGVTVAGKTISWSSSNAAAITIDAAGLARAVAPGTAVITASVDGVTASRTVVATDASLVTLTLTGNSGPLALGSSVQFTASGRDSANQPVAIRSITWKSSNPNIVSVSSTGLVTATGLGTATISVEGVTVTAANATVNITVIPVPTARVVIAPLDTILRFRNPKPIVATARDSAGNVIQRPITYQSSDVDVALLDVFGTATATGQGPVTIYASSGGKRDSVRLYVVSDSGFYVVATGGKPGDIASAFIDIPNGTGVSTQSRVIPSDSASRFNFVTNNGTYRARVTTTADPATVPVALAPVVLQMGLLNGSVVTLRPPSTVAVVPLKPYTATITAPASVARGSQVTVTWTFDETTQPFSFFPDRAPTGALYFSDTNGGDFSGTAVPATVTRDPTTLVSTFSATFTAPAAAGTIYFQVQADAAVGQMLFPIVYRGQALRTITVQ